MMYSPQFAEYKEPTTQAIHAIDLTLCRSCASQHDQHAVGQGTAQQHGSSSVHRARPREARPPQR